LAPYFNQHFLQASSPQDGRPLLVPVHVQSHWTLAVIRWDATEVRFCDSLPEREGAAQDEQQVQKLVWGLLKILVEHFGVTLQPKGWSWL